MTTMMKNERLTKTNGRELQVDGAGTRREAAGARVESPARTEPSRVEPSRVEPSRVEPETATVARPGVETKEATPAPRKQLVKRLAMLAVAAAALVGASTYGYSYYQFSATHESTDDAFIDAHVTAISPRVAGHVLKVNVTDNQQVKAGDVLVELDPSDYQAALDAANGKLVAAQADLVAAKSQVTQANAAVTTAEAQVAQAQADVVAKTAELERANQDLAHYTTANKNGVVSSIELNRVQTEARTAQANLDAAKKVVSAAEAQVAQAKATVDARQGQVSVAQAQITAAQAAVETARLNLSYTKIIAPTDGRITRKSVEPGAYVAPGQLPGLFALVQPDVWVTANFKETQLTHMHAGQKVELKVDAYPGTKFEGHVDSIQQGSGAYFSLMPPENATGNYVKVVQRVPVKIVFDHADQQHLIGPGMSVEPVVSLR